MQTKLTITKLTKKKKKKKETKNGNQKRVLTQRGSNQCSKRRGSSLKLNLRIKIDLLKKEQKRLPCAWLVLSEIEHPLPI
jgi:hypothetical protein